jgi:hypothetical protein
MIPFGGGSERLRGAGPVFAKRAARRGDMGSDNSNSVVSTRLPRTGESSLGLALSLYPAHVHWAEHAARAERRFDDGQKRLPADPEARQKQLVRMAMAASSAGLAKLMEDRAGEATEWWLRSVECYRASWEEAPPGSWGRPIGALKAAVLARDVTAAVETATWAITLRGEESDSEIGCYAATLAALVLGNDEDAARLAAGLGTASSFPKATAAALAALAAHDPARYREAVAAVLCDFEARNEFLEALPVADTVLVLEALAERRGMAVRLRSALLPSAPPGGWTG